MATCHDREMAERIDYVELAVSDLAATKVWAE
jgi:hypothetical protein